MPKIVSRSLSSVLHTLLLASTITFTGAPVAEATDPRILALTKNLDCKAYRLSEIRQRIPLTSDNTIPDAPSAWALLNEGPATATIFVSNGDRVPLPVFRGKIDVFMGDVRHNYAIGLSKNGSAIVRVCR